MSLMY